MSASMRRRAIRRLGVAVAAATMMLAATTGVHASAPELVGVWSEGPALAVEKAGDLGLVSTGRVIRTYDLFDLSTPVELGSVILPGAVLDLEIAGGYSYAAVLGFGVAVVDVSQPSLAIIDVSDPTQPVELSRVTLAGSAVGLALDPVTGLVASAGPDLYLTSIEDPGAPNVVGTYEFDAWVSDIVLDGEVVLGGFGSDGAQVVDISDPTAPTARSTIATAGAPIDMMWTDDVLLAMGTTVSGISFWDLSNVTSRPVQPRPGAVD